MCDLCIAADHARFAVTEVKVGRGAPWAAPLAWLIPPRIALQILMTGDPISAARAHEIGLVNEVVAFDDLRATVQMVARGLATNAPLSVRAAKAMVYASAAAARTAALDAGRPHLGTGLPERGRPGRPTGVRRQTAPRMEGTVTPWR